MKILVVEDDRVSNMVLTSKLTKLGHEVVSVTNGRDGWYTYLKENPSIVITDWMMPLMDGLELCRKIRSRARVRYPYLIMVTALSSREHFYEGMTAGADDFIPKPIDLDTLKARLRVAERVLGLQSVVSQLEGLLQICTYCKKIKTEKGDWKPVDQYVAEHTASAIEKAICPDCGKSIPLNRAAKGKGEIA
jgi:sigma-B regulation protein RsbU (phosphoserine phosphatase)